MNPTSPPARILVADDQPDVREALRLLIKGEGHSCDLFSSPQAALHALGEAEFDLALIDLNYARDTTSGREGLDLLARLQAADPTLPVVVTTAWGTVDLAVEAMRRGALQCLILRRGLRLAVVGIALGLIGALATTRLLRGPDGGAADGVRSLRPPVGPVP